MERIKTEKKYTAVSLFAGIGGFDIGLENAGIEVIWSNDIDKFAAQTYEANVGKKMTLGDIRLVKDQIPKHDILCGGFPCQPFSSLGKLEGFNDKERGTLFFEIKDILQKHKTKVVILENVKNIITHDKGNTFKRILRELDEIGYDCYYQIMDTQHFGIPQRRNRVYIVGFLRENFNGEPFLFPEPLPLKTTTQDLLDKDVDKKYFLSKKILKTILYYRDEDFSAKPSIDQAISKTLTATMCKCHRACQDNYVTDDENYKKFSDETKSNIRKLTPNECRKLQGFPSDWKQVVSDCQAYKQFGNAVTVDVVYYLASKIITYIEKNQTNMEDKNVTKRI